MTLLQILMVLSLFLSACGVKIGNGNHDDGETPPTNHENSGDSKSSKPDAAPTPQSELVSSESFYHAILSNNCVNPLPTLKAGKRKIQFDRGPDRKPWSYTVVSKDNAASIFSETSEFTSIVTFTDKLDVKVVDDNLLEDISCSPFLDQVYVQINATKELRLIRYIQKDGELTEIQVINPSLMDDRIIGRVTKVEGQ